VFATPDVLSGVARLKMRLPRRLVRIASDYSRLKDIRFLTDTSHTLGRQPTPSWQREGCPQGQKDTATARGPAGWPWHRRRCPQRATESLQANPDLKDLRSVRGRESASWGPWGAITPCRCLWPLRPAA